MSNTSPSEADHPAVNAEPPAEAKGVLVPAYRWVCGLVTNIMSRSSFWKSASADKRRDIRDECGHPQTAELDAEFYRRLHTDNSTAARVNELYPKECFKVTPEVYEDEDIEVETQFEKWFKKLDRMLKGRTFHQPRPDMPNEGSAVWDCLKRADIMSGIGHYGVIFFGFDGGTDLSKPVEFIEEDEDELDGQIQTGPTGQQYRAAAVGNAESEPGKPSFYPPKPAGGNPALPAPSTKPKRPAEPEFVPKRKLLFVRVLSEDNARISAFEKDKSSPRFGQPIEYELTLNNTDEDRYSSIISEQDQTTITVHWTRIQHIADNVESCPWAGVPRTRPVLPEVLDTTKVRSGSGEMYYKGAFPGISFETNPNLIPGEIEFDGEGMKDQVERYMNGLQRYFTLQGMIAKSLAPQVVDPNPQLTAQIQGICIKMGCPVRIFMGSERGELSSSQDDADWNDRLKERLCNHVSPNIVAAFIDRLILVGVLPRPKRYVICWPDLTSQTAQEKSAVAFQTTQAITQYVSGNGADLVDPINYLVRFVGPAVGIGEEAAKEIYEKAKTLADARKEEERAFAEKTMRLQAELAPKPPPMKGSAGGGDGRTPRPQGAGGGLPKDGGGRNGGTRR